MQTKHKAFYTHAAMCYDAEWCWHWLDHPMTVETFWGLPVDTHVNYVSVHPTWIEDVMDEGMPHIRF